MKTNYVLNTLSYSGKLIVALLKLNSAKLQLMPADNFLNKQFEEILSTNQTKPFLEAHKMMSHFLRGYMGDLISVGPILSLSPTQGVFLTRSSNPPSCQRQECGHLPFFPSTRSCMQIYIAPPLSCWPSVAQCAVGNAPWIAL